MEQTIYKKTKITYYRYETEYIRTMKAHAIKVKKYRKGFLPKESEGYTNESIGEYPQDYIKEETDTTYIIQHDGVGMGDRTYDLEVFKTEKDAYEDAKKRLKGKMILSVVKA